jgi:hypothetical protein
MKYTASDFIKDMEYIAKGTEDIKVKHPDILKVPENFMKEKNIGDIVTRMITRAKDVGKGPIMRALNNLVRWNKNTNKSFSKKMKSVVEKLKNNEKWEAIPAK